MAGPGSGIKRAMGVGPPRYRDTARATVTDWTAWIAPGAPEPDTLPADA